WAEKVWLPFRFLHLGTPVLHLCCSDQQALQSLLHVLALHPSHTASVALSSAALPASQFPRPFVAS
ncbi:hypothetical protein M513_02495, partial [Trichuris suis]